MIRHGNVTQKNIRQIYLNLGKKIKENSENEIKHDVNKNQNWELITKQGIWKLPIAKQYGGDGLTWDECVSAIEGLTSTYRDYEFFSSIVSHFAVLYILLQYGTESQKSAYLPLLMRGKNSTVCFKEHCSNASKMLNITFIKDINISLSSKEKTHVINDFKNFKRLLYGVLAAESAFCIVDECKEILNKSQSAIFDISIRSKCKDAESNIQKSRQKFNLLLSNFLDKMDVKQIPFRIKK
jgi:hypothetical protein